LGLSAAIPSFFLNPKFLSSSFFFLSFIVLKSQTKIQTEGKVKKKKNLKKTNEQQTINRRGRKY